MRTWKIFPQLKQRLSCPGFTSKITSPAKHHGQTTLAYFTIGFMDLCLFELIVFNFYSPKIWILLDNVILTNNSMISSYSIKSKGRSIFTSVWQNV